MTINVTIDLMQRNAGIGRLSASGASGVTRLKNLYQSGNGKIRIPRRAGHKDLEAVMINIAGGMTGGDTLEWAFEAVEGADLTVTTQACEKIYKSNGGRADTHIALRAASGARINWLPQETILYDGSALDRVINVDLDGDASALIVEPLMFGRQAMGESVRLASIHDRWRIYQNKELIHAEEFRMDGDIANQLSHRAIGNGNCAFATALLITPNAESYLSEVRKIIGDKGGASYVDGKLLLRLVARDSYRLRKTLIPVINCLHGSAQMPKCWTL